MLSLLSLSSLSLSSLLWSSLGPTITSVHTYAMYTRRHIVSHTVAYGNTVAQGSDSRQRPILLPAFTDTVSNAEASDIDSTFCWQPEIVSFVLFNNTNSNTGINACHLFAVFFFNSFSHQFYEKILCILAVPFHICGSGKKWAKVCTAMWFEVSQTYQPVPCYDS